MKIFKKGFTLIELLVVIGILAVLMAGVVTLINPVEKNRQALDAKVFSDIGQFTSSIQAFAATQTDASYPCQTAAAAVCPNPTQNGSDFSAIGPAGSQELQSIPAAPAGSQYLYRSNPTNARPVTAFSVYGRLVSAKYNSQCSAGAGGTQAWYVFNTSEGRACIECLAAAPGAAYVADSCDIFF